MSDEFTKNAIKIAVDKMFNKSSYFSICDVDKLAKVMGVNARNHSSYDSLNLLHCVDYSDMDIGMKEQIASKVFEILTQTKIDISNYSALLKIGTESNKRYLQ